MIQKNTHSHWLSKKIFVLAAVIFIAALGSALLYFFDLLPFFPRTKPSVLVESTLARTDIYLIERNEKTKLSTSANNHRDPSWRGDFVVWVEEPQDKSEKYVVRYHIPTSTRLEITTTGVSQHPRVTTEGRVVWQSWQGESWHIFYFDGQVTSQLTKADTNINPDIAGDLVAYATKLENGEWIAHTHKLETNETTEVGRGSQFKTPVFDGTKLTFF